jgi:hypothetical protein
VSTEHPLDASDDLTGEEYAEAIAEFKADKAAYCRAVDTEGCACIPRPNYPVLADLNRWCRKHGILVAVPAELTWSNPGIRGGEPCMVHTRVPVEQVSTLLEDGATWEQVKDIYPSIPTPEAPREAPQSGAGDAETSGTGSGRGTGEPGLQISTQTIDGESLTGPEIISRTLVLAFGTRHHDRAFIKEIAEALDNALRPVHYREAASSIRSVADGMTYAWQATDAKGMRRAASLLDSTARDLDEEAGR